MDLAKRTEHSLWRGCAALAVVCAAVLCANPAAAQVDIDMPPPPRAKAKKPAQPMTPMSGPLPTLMSRPTIEDRLVKSAYCVAEKRFCVRRNSRMEKAPVPSP